MTLTLPSFAQTPNIGVGTWSLDELTLVEIKAGSTEKQIIPEDINIAKDVFDKIMFKPSNECVLTIQQIDKEAAYILTENSITIAINGKDFLYQYTIDGSKLTLVREFEAGNVSGEWVKFRLTMLFSVVN
jgi:hypothetical protein